MPFQKGKKKTGGRAKDVKNKVNTDFKEAIKNLLERNADQMDGWLTRVSKRSPYKALDLMYKLAEFHMPKLSRQSVDITSKGDKFGMLSDEELNDKIAKLTGKEGASGVAGSQEQEEATEELL